MEIFYCRNCGQVMHRHIRNTPYDGEVCSKPCWEELKLKEIRLTSHLRAPKPSHLVARLASPCNRCEFFIRPGDKIQKDGNYWAHLECQEIGDQPDDHPWFGAEP